jgi:serine/threonine protein kinase
LAADGERDTAAVTGAGVIVGTVHYMGPEQLRGHPAGVSGDLWAIAVMTYEMLAGTLPFPGATMADYQSAVLAGRVTPIRSCVPDASERLEKFFASALAADPALRPGRASQLVDQLQHVLE